MIKIVSTVYRSHILRTLFFLQNARAAAGGHIHDESTAAFEEQIKQQFSGAPPKGKDIEMSGSNLLPPGSFIRRESKVAESSPAGKVNLRPCH